MVDPISTIMNLVSVAAIAIGAILLIWRTSTRQSPTQTDIVLGYPPDQFPAHDIIQQDALQALAASQSRLLAVYDGLPQGSDSAQRLRAFLIELRSIMDVAYHVAVITRAYGPSSHLMRLATEVQQIEMQLSQQMIHRLLSYEADAQEELLSARFASLRALVRDMTPSAETQVQLLSR